MDGRLREDVRDALSGLWWLCVLALLALGTAASWFAMDEITRNDLYYSASPEVLDTLRLGIAEHYTAGHLTAHLIALNAGIRIGVRWRASVAGSAGSWSVAVARSHLVRRCAVAAGVGVLFPLLPMVVTVPLGIARFQAWGYGDTPDMAPAFSDPAVVTAVVASVVGGGIWAVFGVGIGGLTGASRARRWRFLAGYAGLVLLSLAIPLGVGGAGIASPSIMGLVSLPVLMVPSNYVLVAVWVPPGGMVFTRWHAAAAMLLLAGFASSAVVMAVRAARASDQ